MRGLRLAGTLALLALGCSSGAPRGATPLRAYLDLPRATAPSLSRDGKRLAFLAELPGQTRAFYLDLGASSGPAAPPAFVQIEAPIERAQSVVLLGDGSRALLGHDQGGDENTRFSLVDIASGKVDELTPGGGVRHLGGVVDPGQRWLAYSSNARSKADFDVMLRGLDGGAPRLLLAGKGHLEPRAFAPDASSLLLVERRSGADEDLLVLPLGAGPSMAINLTIHKGDARFVDACHAGGALLALSDEGGEFLRLRAIDRLGKGAPVTILEGAFDLDALACSDDGAFIAVAANRGGYHALHLFRVDAAALEASVRMAQTLPPGLLPPGLLPPAQGALVPAATGHSLPPGVIRALSFSADGAELAVQLGRSTEPDQLWTIHTSDGATRKRTDPGAGAARPPVVEPTLEVVRSFDGLEVPLFLFRPRGQAEGRRGPALVWVHGGPEAQFQPAFTPMIQALVARGYVVAAPNVRGSTGYGRRYAHLDDVEKREDSVRDLAAINRWLAARPDVDPGKIAVMGGSYGGYLVLASLALFPDRWAAGVDVSGIASFRSFLERTAPYRRAQREAEYGSLERQGELLDLLSPLRRADRITAPLLLIHGANDPRVPVSEAEQIRDALGALGRPVRLLRYEGEGHGLTQRDHQLDAYSRALAFLDETFGL